MQNPEKEIEILKYPNLFLEQKTVVVKSLKNIAVLKTIKALKTAMLQLNSEAAGLAANQIGEASRVFVYRDYSKEEIFVVINPRIIAKSNKYLPSVEGCLSFPNKEKITVKRFSEIIVSYQKENGRRVVEKITEASDNGKLFVWQHEIDHLDGILFNQISKAWENK
jgi:peptide deformylase